MNDTLAMCYTSFMPQQFRSLADATVLSPDGTSVRIGTLWADRGIVLAFVRHFG